MNLFTGLRSNSKSWDASIWVKNLFDEEHIYLQKAPDAYDTDGNYNEMRIIQERTIGVTLSYNFEL